MVLSYRHLYIIIIISNKANTKSIVNTESTVVDNSNQTETIEESNITEDINRYGNNKIGYITLNKNNWIENKIDDYTVQYTDNKMNITLSLIEQSKINCNELINKLTSVLNDSYKVSVRYESKDDCEIAITNISYSTEQLITIACIQYTNTNNINFIALESNQLQ